MQFSKSILIAAAALIAPIAMNADSMNVSTLSVGDLNFSNFGCIIVNTAGVNATPNTCGGSQGISVGTITVPAKGIEFRSAFFADNGTHEDANLEYTVTSTAGITNVGLSFTPFFLGQAVDAITETIYNLADNGNLLASLKVGCNTNNPCDSNENISLGGGSYTNLLVRKDIQLNSNSGASQFSFVDQTFTEGPGTNVGAATPEPASLALVGAGFLAAGAIRRKMVKA